MSPRLLRYELCDPGETGLDDGDGEYLTSAAAKARNDALRDAGETMRWVLVEESFEERRAA